MQKRQSWVKDIAPTTTTVILASRAAPPHAAGSQKLSIFYKDFKRPQSYFVFRLGEQYNAKIINKCVISCPTSTIYFTFVI